jgi:hypothetical protein
MAKGVTPSAMMAKGVTPSAMWDTGSEPALQTKGERGMRIWWEDGFEIRAAVRGDEVTISANREGMVSLANILLDLAEERPGAHVHLDEYNSLEDGSCELIIERVE